MRENLKLGFLSFIAIPLISACSADGSGAGTSASTVTGLDLSGSWRLAGIECYDSSFQNLTAVGTVSSSSAVGTDTIAGNSLTSSTLGTDSCRVDMSRSIVANLSSGTASGGYGTGTFGATTASIPTGSSCSLTLSFDMTQGSITPSSITSNYTQGQSMPSQEFEFLINPPYLAMTSIIQVVGSPTDICLLIYQKM